MSTDLTRHVRRIARAALLALCALGSGTVAAIGDVMLPNGEYRETVDDLSVKALGGDIVLSRTWLADNINKGEYRWYFNPAWADLRFELDALDGSVKTVVRADSRFERSGNGIYVFDRTFFVTRQADANGATTGWRWYDHNGNWIAYDAGGKIQTHGDRNNVAVRFVRGGPGGRISAVADHHGQTALNFEYSSDGARVTAVVDRTQRRVQYIYEGDRLVEVVDAGGYRWKYGYSGSLLTSVTDPEQHTTTIAYSGNRVTSITDPMTFARTWDYAFDRGKRVYTIVERSPEGRRYERRYDANGRLIRELRGTREVYSLREDGKSVSIMTDERGLTTRVEYDARDNPVKTTNPDGTFSTSKYDGAFNRLVETVDEAGVKTTFRYDAKGNVVGVTEAAGTALQRETSYGYDAFGQIESFTVEAGADSAASAWTYDGYGNVTQTTQPDQTVVGATYDVMGNALTRTDARGKTWTMTYDALGRRLTVENPLGHTTTSEYDKVGNLKKTTNARGKETTYVYDANSRLKSRTSPLGATMSYGYDKDGIQTTVTDAKNVTRTYVVDEYGRTTSAIDGAGNAVTATYGQSVEDAGLLTRMTFPTYCEDYKYDQRGRVTRRIKRLPCEGTPQTLRTLSSGYDAVGRVVSQTDAMQRTTLTAYDALGRPIRSTDPSGGTTELAFDLRNNQTSVKDANGAEHRFAYDKMDRIVVETRPLGAKKTIEYDDGGNILSIRHPSGRRSVFAYDDAGDRVREDHYAPGSATPGISVVFTYDELGLMKTYSQSGDVTSSTVFDYDDAGRNVSEAATYGSGAQAFTVTQQMSYWPNGLRRSFTYSDGTVVNYSHDNANRLEQAGLPSGGAVRWEAFRWRSATRVVMPGVTRSLTHDPLMRLSRVVSQRIGSGTAQAPNGSVVMEENYVYDAAGNLVERTTADGEHDYEYDALDRLTKATPPSGATLPNERYAYDRLHNRASSEQQAGPWNYNTEGQLLTFGIGAAERRFEYDADGNTVEAVRGTPASPDETIAFSYGADGRLASVMRNGEIVGQYQYDPLGRRIRKQTATGTTWYQYSAEGLIGEFSENGAIRKAYGWVPGSSWSSRPLWMADKVGGPWRTSVYHLDRLGVPRKLTDSDGNVVWSSRSTAFGEMQVDPASTVDNPLRFPGQYFDAETGLHYNFFRYYWPELGRYVERDPIGIEGGISVYSYVDANPLMGTDALGLFGQKSDDQFCLQHPSGCVEVFAPRPIPRPLPKPAPSPPPPGPGPKVPVPPIPPNMSSPNQPNTDTQTETQTDPETPAKPDTDTQQKKKCPKTCESDPQLAKLDRCDKLSFDRWPYWDKDDAARKNFGRDAKAVSGRPATGSGGGCKVQGLHYNVHVAGKYDGHSVLTCKCCREMGGEPKEYAKYRVTRRAKEDDWEETDYNPEWEKYADPDS